MKRIGRKELAYFEEDSTGYTDQIVLMNCRRSIMCWVYSTLKFEKLITPIELLDQDVKNKMWAIVKEICAGRVNDQKKMIEVCKTFYVLEYFLKQQE